jgi:HEAT repeat protein
MVKQLTVARIEDLCVNHKDKVVEIVSRMIDYSPSTLTYLAEEINRCFKTKDAAPLLVKLLNHEHPVVREGALIGIEEHLSNKTLLNLLTKISKEDEREIIREIAADIIKKYKEEK